MGSTVPIWPPRRPLIVSFALLAVLPIACSVAVSSQDSAEHVQCWSQSSLRFRPGEQFIQRRSRAAFISPPKQEASVESPISAGQVGVVRRVDVPAGAGKMIALTFDLCEQPDEVAGYQGDIVDLLRTEQARATFFAGGKWLLTHKLRAQQLMSDPLFEVANHTWEHRNLRLTSTLVLQGEIRFAQLAYTRLRKDLVAKECVRPDEVGPAAERVPEQMTLFRFPFGACDVRSLEAVAAAGLTAIQWDVSSGDPWPGQSASMMARDVLRRVQSGSIVLFHANGRGWHTAAALREVLRDLKIRGYRFVTVSELLQAGRPVVSQACYDVRPGDTNRYDRLARRLEERYRRWRLGKNTGEANQAHE